MGIDVRGTPEAVDELRLTEALAEAGVARGATVTGVELTQWIGTGQTGRNARFRLTCAVRRLPRVTNDPPPLPAPPRRTP